MRTVRPIPEGDRDLAVQLASDWGYPRPIGLLERKYAYWVQDVPLTGMFWLVEGPVTPGHYCVHVVSHPDHKGELGRFQEVMQIVRVTAGLIGATRVYAPLLDGYPGWAKFLMGTEWFQAQDTVGPYFDLEG